MRHRSFLSKIVHNFLHVTGGLSFLCARKNNAGKFPEPHLFNIGVVDTLMRKLTRSETGLLLAMLHDLKLPAPLLVPECNAIYLIELLHSRFEIGLD